MSAIKVTADDAANAYRDEIRATIDKLKAKGITPLLVGFLANGDVAAKKYAEWTGKACEADGIQFEVRECDKMELEDKLQEAIADSKVHGIMIYYPCFGGAPSFYGGNMDDYLRDSVPIEKDVEGLCDTVTKYRGGVSRPSGHAGTKKFKMYDEKLEVGERMKGKNVCVINRSEIVGRPLAAMLANDGADVYSIDISSTYLMRRGKMLEVTESQEELVKKAHIVITGVPAKDYRLPTSWIQPNTVVMNVSHFKNVDEDALMQIPGVKYVPLVGKVTVAMLERNLLRLIENFHLPESA